MTLKLNGSSSGSVSIDAPASTTGGADVTFKFPVADGSANQVLQTNGSGQLQWVTLPTSPIIQEKYYTETATLECDSSSTWDTGTSNSFTKQESSSDSIIVYNWNGYLADYANSGSNASYRLAYTPAGGSVTYLNNITYIDQHTGGWRQHIPISLNYTITSLNAGAHTFQFQCKWDGVDGNNNAQFIADAHNRIIIREVSI
tara:strand:- start:671 stop:1273 length:603 start_codon:yes stop_codon:yes gene_type:complete